MPQRARLRGLAVPGRRVPVRKSGHVQGLPTTTHCRLWQAPPVGGINRKAVASVRVRREQQGQGYCGSVMWTERQCSGEVLAVPSAAKTNSSEALS
jgi:hypothetical protein